MGTLVLKLQKNTSLDLERKRAVASVSGRAGRVVLLKSVTWGIFNNVNEHWSE